MKSFEEFIKNGVIRKQTPQISRAKDLVEESDKKFANLKEFLDKVGLKDQNANDVIESCYSILIFLVRAKLFVEGYSSLGYGAHEAEVSFMARLGFNISDLEFMDKLRYFRNGINYYGTKLDVDYAQKVINFVNKIRPKLKKLIDFNLK